MNEIFVSYARADASKAKTMAEALNRQGFSVWWDRDIPPGQSFDKVIESALTEAKCVVVLWSQASTSSDWVKTEAAEGARRGILVPVLVEKVAIPLEFRRLQTADLSKWHGDLADPIFTQFVNAVGTLLNNNRKVQYATIPTSDIKRSTMRPLVVILGVIVLAGAGLAMQRYWQSSQPAIGAEQISTPAQPISPVHISSLSWGPDHGRDAGACIDGCSSFIPWSELRGEIERSVFPLTPNLPTGVTATLASLGGVKNKVIQVTDANGIVLGNAWIGVDPASNWRFDGILRVGANTNPPQVWASFERLSNGTYRKR